MNDGRLIRSEAKNFFNTSKNVVEAKPLANKLLINDNRHYKLHQNILSLSKKQIFKIKISDSHNMTTDSSVSLTLWLALPKIIFHISNSYFTSAKGKESTKRKACLTRHITQTVGGESVANTLS